MAATSQSGAILAPRLSLVSGDEAALSHRPNGEAKAAATALPRSPADSMA